MLTPMSTFRRFRLASLRRAPALAGFMLVVFLVRIGITMACEPHEFAELFGGETEQMLVAASGDDADRSQLSEHAASDHCRQCSCHHGVALSCPPVILAAMTATTVASFDDIPRTDVPPQRELRPPIV